MTRLTLATVGEVAPGWVAEAAGCLEREFATPVRLAPALPEPAGAWDQQRRQFGAVAYLETLARFEPGAPGKLVGLTERDIFIPMLTFLFGQAQLGGRAALVSLARLRPEFYGLPPDPELTAARLRKETLHELGHTFGLVHCPARECVMSLSTSIRQVDLKRDAYCSGCRRILDEARRATDSEEQE